MHLMVGIPALNEAATIAEVVAGIPRELDGVDRVTVLVVDDGSTDDTAQLARAAGAEVVCHFQNSGVGAAFQSIVRQALAARCDILVTIDADGQFNSDDIPALVEPILTGRAAVCTASRFLDAELVPDMPGVKIWGNHRVAQLVSAMTGQQYADVSCGFRAYGREALLRLTVYHSFTYTHETFLDLAIKRIPIVEIPIRVRGTRAVGESRVASSVLRYGVRTAGIMLRTYRDHRPLKLCLMVAAPFVALAIGLASWSLVHLSQTGSWLKWAAFTAAASATVALMSVSLGFLADMATRLRLNQEEIIYWLRYQVDAASAPASAPGAKPGAKPASAAGAKPGAKTGAKPGAKTGAKQNEG
jgi:glycosyltransferase involved in cell wall biosynthesis